jgi:SAV_6107-like HEPN
MTTTTTTRRLTPEAVRLLMTSRSALREAERAPTPGERYATAHLAALRAAAAVLAARARPLDGRSPRARRPTSAWVLLTAVAPELSEWASYFAAGAGKRAAAEAGLRHAATAREADDLLRDATTFLALVETTVGVLPEVQLDRAG